MLWMVTGIERSGRQRHGNFCDPMALMRCPGPGQRKGAIGLNVFFGNLRNHSQGDVIFRCMLFPGFWLIFSARCTLVQSAVLRSHVVRPSVRLSVTLVDCDHIGWNSSEIISPLVSPGCSLSADPNIRVYSKGNTRKFWPKDPPPVDLSVGDIRSQIAAEWLQIDSATVTMESL